MLKKNSATIGIIITGNIQIKKDHLEATGKIFLFIPGIFSLILALRECDHRQRSSI